MNDMSEPARADKHAHEAVLVAAQDPRQELATPEELAAFQGRFLKLLERRTATYTMGDSTSVPKHVAADLLRSVCFVLGIDPDDPQIPRRLLSVDLEREYRRRIAEIEREVQAAKQLWRDVCATMPLIENIALRDTLKNLGEFFRWYDYRSMAHEIPCSIDYPLCHPVPESLRGIDYIYEYLRRLMIEADFLQPFALQSIERVLANSCPDHIELLINLYEPVGTNAIGRVLAEKDPRELSVTDEDRAKIAHRLGALPRGRRGEALRDAALAVCERLEVDDPAARGYLVALADDLLPRIEVGLSGHGLAGVFVTAS